MKGKHKMQGVVWVDAENMAVDNTVSHKLIRLIQESGIGSGFSSGQRVSLKVNTAEEGYEYGLRPRFFSTVANIAHDATQKRPVLCDGQKLVDYWKRSKGNTFLEVAEAMGYSNETLGGHFVINGGFSGDEGDLFPCGHPDSEIGGVEVGTAVCRSDMLGVLSHVTFHPMFGLSGALFNGGFECLSARERTRLLHGANPYIFNGQRPGTRELQRFQQRALESHLGVSASVEGRVFYINYLWDVTPQPEYYPYSAKPVIENLGFLASSDPVALDAASFSLVEERRGSCRKITGINFREVLRAAESLGIGKVEGNIEQLS
jgi:uncharacterized Fe-S center protein